MAVKSATELILKPITDSDTYNNLLWGDESSSSVGSTATVWYCV